MDAKPGRALLCLIHFSISATPHYQQNDAQLHFWMHNSIGIMHFSGIMHIRIGIMTGIMHLPHLNNWNYDFSVFMHNSITLCMELCNLVLELCIPCIIPQLCIIPCTTYGIMHIFYRCIKPRSFFHGIMHLLVELWLFNAQQVELCNLYVYA